MGLVDHLLGLVDLSLAASYGAKARCVRRDFRPSALRFGVPAGKMNDLLKPALFRILCDCDLNIPHIYFALAAFSSFIHLYNPS